MDVQRVNRDLHPYVQRAVDLVGAYAWRQLVNEARREGRNARQAVINALHRVRDNLADYTEQLNSSKRKRAGEKSSNKKANTNIRDSVVLPNMGDDINFSRSSHRIGRTRKRTAAMLFKAEVGAMYESIFRFQRVSPSLLGPGQTPISYGYNPASPAYAQSARVLPFHFMSLTHNPAFAGIVGVGTTDLGMCRATYQTIGSGAGWTGNCGYQGLTNQGPSGVTTGVPTWTLEKGIKHGSFDRVFHKWSDIRLNLYGSLYYPLKYQIMVVTGLEQDMNFHEYPLGNYANPHVAEDFAIDNDAPLNQFIVDSVKGLVSNPIVGSNTDHNWKGKIKYLYNKSVTIPCLSYGNGTAQAASGIDSTNVKSMNIFMRHDRFRNYQWYTRPGNNTENLNLSGVGYAVKDDNITSDMENISDVDREERVYFIITCTSPKVDESILNDIGYPWAEANNDPAAAQSVFGSYDVVVRNCFRSGTGEPHRH